MCHCKVPTTILRHSSVCQCLFIYMCRIDLTSYCLEILVLAQLVSLKRCRSFPLIAVLLFLSHLSNTELYLDWKSGS